MLVRLLRTYLRPYRWVLLTLVGLQAVQALAGLYLPYLNADVIDKGVMRGDTGYIWRMGGFMLAVTAVQLAFTVLAVYLGSRVAMGFGRDVRDGLFHRVTGFSAREMNRFGAPSLITRITNDVQQVQMLVVMAANLALAAPVTVIGGVVMAIRQDGGLAWLLAVSMPVLILAMGSVMPWTDQLLSQDTQKQKEDLFSEFFAKPDMPVEEAQKRFADIVASAD